MLAQVARTFGVRDGALRLQYELQRGSGWMLRRMHAKAGWDAWELPRIAAGVTAPDLLESRRGGRPRFFFRDPRTIGSRLKNIVGIAGERKILADAENVLSGKLPYFGRLWFECGVPPNWFRNPVTGEQVDPSRPWTTMRFASPDYGDLKFILEPSRFLFVYPLARAYALNGDERLARAFWEAVEDWMPCNPPMAGPLWVCGQESSLRILAWSFGLYAFLGANETTAERVSRLTSLVAAHAWRAHQTVGYARSQRSNHLISEAVGMWTAGTLFPELRDAASWQSAGMRLLEEAVADQFSPEGVHLQYSFNYQRMVLQLLLWTLRLAQLHGVKVPEGIERSASRGLSFLRAMVDPESGHAPNYGSNDGSFILPLSSCDYGDYRPLVQTGSCVLGGKPALKAGPWDEEALWLCGEMPGRGDEIREPSAEQLAQAGFYRLGGRESWALVRAGRYVRRPFQADQLHVDLWHKGVNLARDAGTYLYNGATPWDNGLARTRVHNTVTIDEQEQMRRAGRFLWVDWAQAWGRSFASTSDTFPDTFEGEHDGYRRIGVRHHRTVRYLNGAAWVVLDDIFGEGEHEVAVHWLLPDGDFERLKDSGLRAALRVNGESVGWRMACGQGGKAIVVREGTPLDSDPVAHDTELLGRESPTYGERLPALSLLYTVQAKLPVRVVTVISFSDLETEIDQQEVVLKRSGAEEFRASLFPEGAVRLAEPGTRS
jgi:asparagine synthase (glutamine-hydrolysing)